MKRFALLHRNGQLVDVYPTKQWAEKAQKYVPESYIVDIKHATKLSVEYESPIPLLPNKRKHA